MLLPCYNEEKAIGRVVSDFKRVLPNASIFVYDNNSIDRTMEEAREAGAMVRREPRQGKGHVVRRMFADIEADIFILVDGDATYDADSAPKMINLLLNENLDMVTAVRIHKDPAAYRRGHRFGNVWLTGLVSLIFRGSVSDMLSGYRVLSRRFVKSFPAAARGFETETELTVHALELSMPTGEIKTPYFPRIDGSQSKLSTYTDGIKILRMIMLFIKDERPLPFFTLISAVLLFVSIVLGTPLVIEWLQTGLVPRLPTSILATGIALLSFLSLASGIILNSVALSRREVRRFVYLSMRSPSECSICNSHEPCNS